MHALLRTVLILIALPMVAAAQATDRMTAMRAAHAEWVVRHNLRSTGMLAFEGTPATALGNGSAPVELASLSKSITALCAVALSDAGGLEMSESVRDVLGRGPDVPVSTLVTHTSGIVADITQPLMGLWLDTAQDRAGTVLNLMKEPQGGPGVFHYNNVNYALLALVIEARAQASYEQTCRHLVLDPAGARGAPSSRTGALLSWGGWAMSPHDYARLHGYWFGTATATGRAPLDYPHVALGDTGAFYGLGTFFRENQRRGGGYNFWHFGALCFPRGLNVGAYVATWGGRWTAVIGYDACVDQGAMGELDHLMSRAAFWPFE